MKLADIRLLKPWKYATKMKKICLSEIKSCYAPLVKFQDMAIDGYETRFNTFYLYEAIVTNGDRKYLAMIIKQTGSGYRRFRQVEIESPYFKLSDIDTQWCLKEVAKNPDDRDSWFKEIKPYLDKLTEFKTSDTLSDKAKEVFGGIDNI